MFLKKSEHKPARSYVSWAVGALATVGMINIVRCCKRSVKSVCHGMTSVFKPKKMQNQPSEMLNSDE